MAEERFDLILDMLRAIRDDIGGMREDIRELKHGMSMVEQQVSIMIATVKRRLENMPAS